VRAAATVLAALALLVPAPAPAEERPADLPATLEGWVRRQDGQMAAGKGEEAVAEARARVAAEKSSVEARYLLGRVLGNTGDLDGARAQFAGVLELDGLYAPAWRGLAKVHILRKEPDTALREARKAHDLDPSSREGTLLLAECLFEGGDRAGAHVLLNEAIKADPKDTAFRGFRATLLIKEGRTTEAEREVRVALAEAPADPGLRRMLVWILRGTGRGSEAVAECREAIRRAPREPDLHVLLRDLCVEAEDWNGAVEAVQALLKLDLPEGFKERARKDVESLRAARDRPPAPAGERAIEDLVKDLGSPDPARRREAIRSLEERPLDGVPKEVQKCLQDSDEGVRVHAVRIFGRYGTAAAAAVFEILLYHPTERDPSPAVRIALARALARLGTPASLPVLLALLEDGESEVFGSAVRGIAEVTGKCFVLDPEAPVPEKDRPAVRAKYLEWWAGPTGLLWKRKAAVAIGDTGSHRLVTYAVPWLESDDAPLRGAVLEGLALATKDPSWREVPTGTPVERRAAQDRARTWARGGR